MKRIFSILLSVLMLCTLMSTVAFAAPKADGSVNAPFTDVPQTTVDDSGNCTSTAKEITVTTKFGLTITSLETKNVTNADGVSKWVLTNPLNAPTAATIKTNIAVTNADATNSNIEVKLNNQVISLGAYSFKAGTTQEFVVTRKAKTDGSVTGQMFWTFVIPDNDKIAPTLTVTPKSGTATMGPDGIITVSGDASIERTVQLEANDNGSGIASIQITGYQDAGLATPALIQRYHKGGVTPCNEDPCSANVCTLNDGIASLKSVYGAQNVTLNADTGAIKSIVTLCKFTETSEYLKITLTDKLGNKSIHQVNVIGITSTVDSAAPAISVGPIQKSTDAAGAVTGITGTVSINDALSGLKVAKIMQGDAVLWEDVALNGAKSKDVSFSFKKADAKKTLTVTAEDMNGNKAAQWTADYAKEFGEDGGTPGPDPGKDTVNPTVAYVSSIAGLNKNGIVSTFRFTDAGGLKKVTIDNGVTAPVVWNAPTGTAPTTTDVTFATEAYMIKNGSNLTVTAVDAAGNSATVTKNVATIYANIMAGKDEGGGKPTDGKITSNRLLRKAVTGPTFTYEEDYTNATFNIDQKLAPGLKFDWVLKRGTKEIDSATNVDSYSYSFEKGYDKAGSYTLAITYGDYDVKFGFNMEYRDDTLIANALKVTKTNENGKCTIDLTLDRDLLDDAKKTKWTLPDGSTDTGYNVEYVVNNTGTYSFTMKLDGEKYTQKVEVDNLSTDDENDSGNNNNNNSGNGGNGGNSNDGTTAYTGSNAPSPGKGVINGITANQLTIEVPMNNWDQNQWSVLANSVPANVSYSTNGNTIVFKVPNSTFKMGFKLVNKSNQYVYYNFPVNALNNDGTGKTDNAQTGGAGTSSTGFGGAVLAPEIDLRYKKRKGTVLDDSDIL